MLNNKTYLSNIENSFSVLKQNTDDFDAINLLIIYSEKLFKYKFNINVINPKINTDPLFIMSVYPDQSTVEKIVDAISNNDSKVITKLWKQTKLWTIEIDSRILDGSTIDLNERELTAIYCHEIGHIINSNSVPNRIVTILQYEIAKSSVSSKSMIRDSVFKKFLSLPVLNACVGGSKNNSLKDEIKADKFVKKMGYTKDLVSVMKKIEEYNKKTKNVTADESMKMIASFTTDAMNQFKARETSLLESTLNRMNVECESPYVKKYIDDIYNTFFSESKETSVSKDKKLNLLYERASKLEDEFIATEFFGIGKKTLKRIDPADIDYILIKMKGLETNSDKMMLVSYIHSKIDIVDYYIALINNPKQTKKYNIPYTINELYALKDKLQQMVKDTIDAKLVNRNEGLLVHWPSEYDG